MKNIKQLAVIGLLSLPLTQTLAAEPLLEGDVRIGLGKSQTLGFSTDYEYTTFEVGYDVDRIFGITADYSKPDDDFIPNRLSAGFEVGYEFGNEFTIRPYASGGVVHMQGNGAVGSTWGMFGVGLRASYKMFYINASFDYLPASNSSGPADGGTYWVWEQHESASLLVGLRF